MLILFLLLFIGIYGSIYYRKLTFSGAMVGGIIAIGVYLGAGFIGISILGAFFIMAAVSTKWKRGYKRSIGFEEGNKGIRNAYQVIANGGVACCIGIVSAFFAFKYALFPLMVAASLSAATADTLSSELGIVYGKTHFNISTFQKDQRGLDGVISLEGTLLGLFGSIVIAIIYAIGFGWSFHVLWIIIGGLVGNLGDSLLGALLERKGHLTNNTVNFINTLLGALTAGLLDFIN
jgi:uncharacterized protein (TIGR00297 family)